MPTAYFLINTVLNQEIEVIAKIKKILNEQPAFDFEIQGVYGVYDIIVKITSDSEDKIRHLGLEKIKTIEKIQSTITMMVNDN
jgi:DNA-binding Lrp family transcriptional regulator